jgi:hypothetical protein
VLPKLFFFFERIELKSGVFVYRVGPLQE